MVSDNRLHISLKFINVTSVAHTYNPNNSGSLRQKDDKFKPSLDNLGRPHLKKLFKD